jgi:tRNA dimethylallyltransferase
MPPLPLLFLGGPTAVGKSAVALCLAERLNGEIVSVDSMQVYRGLDLGTAKPSPADRARVPHHLIDVAELTEPFDAARFVGLARAAVAQIRARGRLPVLSGGTGLYFKAFLEGLDDVPPAQPALRAELEAAPPARLLAELQARDPATYARIDRHNLRRVVRALEIIRLTGRPAADQRAAWSPTAQKTGDRNASDAAPFCFFGLRRSREDLGRRIQVRVEGMFDRGLVAETQRLLASGLEQNQAAMQAIGYRQVVEHLHGQRGLAETIARVQARTRQFARRQSTWFRRQLPVRWMDVAPGDPAEVVAGQIEAFLLSESC